MKYAEIRHFFMAVYILFTKFPLAGRAIPANGQDEMIHQVTRPLAADAFRRLSVRNGDSLRETLDWFRQFPLMRLLTVVDENDRPLGAIREIDIRAMLFNPFGHALLSNPGFGRNVSGLITPCSVAEVTASQSDRIAAFTAIADSPGLILTSNGQFSEAFSSDSLVEMIKASRIERAERIAKKSKAFTDTILSLSSQLTEAASRIQSLSDSLAQQAGEMTDAAQIVAVGAEQSSNGLQDVHDRGRQLSQAGEQLSEVAARAKAIRSRTSTVVEAAAPQMRALAECGAEIGDIMGVIQQIGRKTNFLALNAQIEAVREADNGQSSQGFVAVANEIKQLANQTRSSATEISGKVDRIGNVVGHVLSGHDEIVKAMESVSEISNKVEMAVEAQSNTGLIIAGYVEQAASAIQQISARAQDIRQRADHVHGDARELKQFSSLLLNSAQAISHHSRDFVDLIQ